jgi:hypothetical protein
MHRGPLTPKSGPNKGRKVWWTRCPLSWCEWTYQTLEGAGDANEQERLHWSSAHEGVPHVRHGEKG